MMGMKIMVKGSSGPICILSFSLFYSCYLQYSTFFFVCLTVKKKKGSIYLVSDTRSHVTSLHPWINHQL